MRLPIVMVVVNRALSAPISIWNDHSDVMCERDVGWVQFFVENGQEALDFTLMAFRIGEDPEVSLPAMVNLDGFILSHVIEPVMMPDPEETKKFLPQFKPRIRLDPKNPISMGMFGMPDVFTETKKACDVALVESRKTIDKTLKEFEGVFGRKYDVIEYYGAENADTILVTMGSVGETAMTAVDEMTAEGRSVGLLKLRLWRPFPDEDVKAVLKKAKNVAVVDRAMTAGSNCNPVGQEIRSLLYNDKDRPNVFDFTVGLGGRDVTRDNFKYICVRCGELAGSGQDRFEMVGVME
jgi:pyruvate ferredoxin oxidoreductase alpha subunit